MTQPEILEDDALVVACPECDSTQITYRRGDGHSRREVGDPTHPFSCSPCDASFTEAVVRPRRDRAKYAELTVEDVDL